MRMSTPLFGLALWSSTMIAGEFPAIDYRQDVRPILANNCYPCHGPDKAQRVNDLRLDLEESPFQVHDSGIPIVPGEVEASHLVTRVTSSDPEERMPPQESGKRLSAKEIETLKRWIAGGAAWGRHWSFEKPTRREIPPTRNTGWSHNRIDAFVLARLEKESLEPTIEADRRTLIRRLAFSLTGLPPSVEEISRFLQDGSPDAYEQLVDRLLDSPKYGEHMARYWLDIARYGDTHGLHLDNERSIWRYRDWVIDAYNQNLPFDQFTVEQLAGDLLPEATIEQRIATGFSRCNVTTSEGGAIADEFLARYAVDRVETMSTAWMGLTIGCAACHDHKFDPISQTEFYQLFAYFNNLTERAMDGNALLPPPSVKAPTLVQQHRHRELVHQRVEIESQIEARRLNFAQNQFAWEDQLVDGVGKDRSPQDSVVHLSFDGSLDDLGKSRSQPKLVGMAEYTPGKIGQALRFDGKTRIQIDDVGDFDRSDAFSWGGWVNFSTNDRMSVLSKLHDDADYQGYDLYLDQRKVFVSLIHERDGNAIRVNTKLPITKEKWHHVFATYDGSSTARGVKIYVDGSEQELDVSQDQLTETIKTDRPFQLGGRDQQEALFNGLIDDVQLFARELQADEVAAISGGNPLAEILAIAPSSRTSREQARLVDVFLRDYDDVAVRLFIRLRDLQQQIDRLKNEYPSTLVMQDRQDLRETFVLVRGQYDQKGAEVLANVPAALPQLPDHSERSRLTLARWLVSPEHPLTARVAVNRVWQQHFGIGLVKSSEDFGAQGAWPSHPELLDYLAVTLIDSGWDMKSLHRMIVTSSTFRQSSSVTPELFSRDPENRLLARGPRFRLDAEVIRDLALAASELLVTDVGGPSGKPYQPPGLWEAVGYTTSNTAKFKQDRGAPIYRRSMYTFWKRTSPPPPMQILDAPSREVCTIRRPRTNTPSAALLLMNETQFVESARKFAEQILGEGGDATTSRLDFAYHVALGRPPTEDEMPVLQRMVESFSQAYSGKNELAEQLLTHGEAPVESTFSTVELATWTMMASTILNLDETITQH